MADRAIKQQEIHDVTDEGAFPDNRMPEKVRLKSDAQASLSGISFEIQNEDYSEKALASPAKRLQYYLDTELGSEFGQDVIEGRWSPRRTIAFVVCSSVFLWAMVFMAVKAIM